MVPRTIRERTGLTPGSHVEISEDEQGIRIERIAAGPRLVKVSGRLVARPTAPIAKRPAVDFVALIERERHGGTEFLAGLKGKRK